eukprot:177988_1
MPHTPQMHVIPYLLVSDYARCQFRSMTTGMALSILCGIYLIVSFVVLLAVPVSSRDLRWYMVLLSVETERIGIRVLNLFITMCIRDDKRNISWSLSSSLMVQSDIMIPFIFRIIHVVLSVFYGIIW